MIGDGAFHCSNTRLAAALYACGARLTGGFKFAAPDGTARVVYLFDPSVEVNGADIMEIAAAWESRGRPDEALDSALATALEAASGGDCAAAAEAIRAAIAALPRAVAVYVREAFDARDGIAKAMGESVPLVRISHGRRDILVPATASRAYVDRLLG